MNAILVAVTTAYDIYDVKYSLDELENLAKAIDINTVFKISQKLDSPNSKTYVGKGKLSEIIIAINAYNADLIIFNDELSPSQLRNVSDALQIECIDRSYLILKIFEERAQTKEAALEIKLVKNLYLLPRIAFLREKESRIGGTSGSLSNRGAGETQAELDRRHILAEINHLKNELKNLKMMKESQIEKRKKNDIPIVALVGYTNAGKSSTMNSLLEYIGQLDKQVYEKDQLFATLSTYNRKITYDKKEFILVDTVGFVSKLPHTLVNSFYQTLTEIQHADYIIHVVDSSSPYINEQINVVLQVLTALQADKIPTLFLLNKWDKNKNTDLQILGYPSLQFSNKTKLNLKELFEDILSHVGPSTIRVKLLIPYKEGKYSHILEKTSYIYHKDFQTYGTYYDVELPLKQYHLFQTFDLENMVN
ncbi:MAG: GTPase HflX [Roseburia sp.]|nr:GTPase HflX [Anaeroplasma bactoclasticum]MCM1196799.1 GTPase HflX [Roseburia sp.]MCM1557262.1 GTPase HflX [Anaeroplasma bactoclasticum]